MDDLYQQASWLGVCVGGWWVIECGMRRTVCSSQGVSCQVLLAL